MPTFRYGKRYAKVLLTAPGASSIAVCLLGVLLTAGVVVYGWRGSRLHFPVARLTPARPATRNIPADRATQPTQELGVIPAFPQRVSSEAARTERTRPPLDRAIFGRAVAKSQFEFLSDFGQQPPDGRALRQGLSALIDMVAPYTPFHYGVDRPLPQAMESVLFLQPFSLETRAGRYAIVANHDRLGTSGRRRGFLWIDLKRGIVLGVIFFHPTNGEPTPTLTIFSTQVRARRLRMRQLPRAFVEDLGQWSAATGLPPIVTRYFINPSGEKFVLAHDENYCSPAAANFIPPGESCKQMNAEAAAVDAAAARFLKETHHASNATMHIIAETGNRAVPAGGVQAQ